jgi:hypothetical protein
LYAISKVPAIKVIGYSLAIVFILRANNYHIVIRDDKGAKHFPSGDIVGDDIGGPSAVGVPGSTIKHPNASSVIAIPKCPYKHDPLVHIQQAAKI